MPGALTLPMRDPLKMIREVCTGQVDGALLEGRLIYGALLDQPAACANHPLLVVPLPQSALPMATFARPAVKQTADRLFAGIEQIALDGTLTALRQPVVRVCPSSATSGIVWQNASSASLNMLYGAGVALFSLLCLWNMRRSLRTRRTAQEALDPRQARRSPVRRVHGTHARQ